MKKSTKYFLTAISVASLVTLLNVEVPVDCGFKQTNYNRNLNDSTVYEEDSLKLKSVEDSLKNNYKIQTKKYSF